MCLFQIVDSIASTPNVLFDLNEAFGVAEGSSFTPPPVRRSNSWTSLADGSIESDATYGDREIGLTLDGFHGAAEEQVANLQQLGRLLSSPQWLKVQPDGMAHPVFFRTRRAETRVVDSLMTADPVRSIDLTIPADPFAYGLPESGQVTIRNNPITGTNRMCAVLDPAKGDVPSPLELSFVTPARYTSGGRNARYKSVVSSTPVPAGTTAAVRVAVPIVGSHGSTTVTSTADATMATGTRIRVDPSVVGESNTFLLGITNLAPGPYNVYLRARVNGHSFSAWLTSGDESRAKTLRRSNPNAVGVEWFDLGTYWLPKNSLDGGDPFGLLPANPGSPRSLALRYLESSTQFIDLDCVIFVPAGDDTHTATQSTFDVPASAYTPPVTLTLDGVNDARYTEFPDSGVTGTLHVGSVAGGIPSVTPDSATALTVLPVVAFDSAAYSEQSGLRDEIPDPLNTDTVVAWKYFPRYLYLRGIE